MVLGGAETTEAGGRAAHELEFCMTGGDKMVYDITPQDKREA
jgi:hypothetical protein